MNEDLKRHPDKAFMLFQKVYIYYTNTKKPWIELSEKEKNSKKFKWYCDKWFVLSKKQVTEKQVIEHIKTCPELKESADDILKNNVDPTKKWKHHSIWTDVYKGFPIRDEHEFKLLVNTIGLRMLHFM